MYWIGVCRFVAAEALVSAIDWRIAHAGRYLINESLVSERFARNSFDWIRLMFCGSFTGQISLSVTLSHPMATSRMFHFVPSLLRILSFCDRLPAKFAGLNYCERSLNDLPHDLMLRRKFILAALIECLVIFTWYRLSLRHCASAIVIEYLWLIFYRKFMSRIER